MLLLAGSCVLPPWTSFVKQITTARAGQIRGDTCGHWEKTHSREDIISPDRRHEEAWSGHQELVCPEEQRDRKRAGVGGCTPHASVVTSSCSRRNQVLDRVPSQAWLMSPQCSLSQRSPISKLGSAKPMLLRCCRRLTAGVCVAGPCASAVFSPGYAVGPSAVPVADSNGVGRHRRALRASSGWSPARYDVPTSTSTVKRGPRSSWAAAWKYKAPYLNIPQFPMPLHSFWSKRNLEGKHHRGSVDSSPWIVAAGEFGSYLSRVRGSAQLLARRVFRAVGRCSPRAG